MVEATSEAAATAFALVRPGGEVKAVVRGAEPGMSALRKSYALIFDLLLLRSRAPYRATPFTLYSALGFTIAAIVSLPVRIALH
jgi:hypothetical protein